MTAYPDFRGKNVTVVGLGIEGVDLVRYLAAQGAQVTVSDARPADRLGHRLRELDGIAVRLGLGENAVADTVSADVVFVSQGVPLDIPALEAARQKGVPLSSMTRLFLELCPGPVVGITGSSGKTTTTSLVGAVFAAAGRPHAMGGNIGVGLLGLLDELTPETWVVAEISHTQLELMDRSPHVACVLNVTPNHLDRYSWPDYVALKGRILAYQGTGDLAVLNYENEVTRRMADDAAAEVLFFAMEVEPPGDGAFLRDGVVVSRRGGRETPVLAVSEVPLRGRHNLSNVVAAVAVGGACGLLAPAMASAIRAYRPVPHRLELVANVGGAAYYNDSIATTPERTLAGVRSFEEPLVLLLGGREKHLPLEEMAAEACRRCRAVVVFGEAAPVLEEALWPAAEGIAPQERPQILRVSTLAEAVEAASGVARPGDVVLLSPACTSYDAFENFEQRGEEFRRLVLAPRPGKGGYERRMPGGPRLAGFGQDPSVNAGASGDRSMPPPSGGGGESPSNGEPAMGGQ
jgi:UDP-N-acetylmuramoylalanine--D-glutamate ligase